MEKRYEVGFLIKQIQDGIEKHANNDLRENNLTMVQNRVIMLLHMSPDAAKSLKELEKEFNVSQPTMAGIIRRLTDKGYVTTFGDPSDKRIKIVRLTGAGIERGNEARKYIEKMEAKLLSNLSQEEQIQFRQLLLKVLSSIN